MADILEIQTYRAFWNTQYHEGRIKIYGLIPAGKGKAKSSVNITVSDANEMHMLVDLLRNETLVHFDRETELFTTDQEVVGEGE